MAITLDDMMKRLSPARRRKVEARAAELIAEELSLRDLRKARAKTQATLAKKLGIGQDGISRLEQRSDLMISTLGRYIESMGGELHLIAEFPDRPPVRLRGFATLDVSPQTKQITQPRPKTPARAGLAEPPAKPFRAPARKKRR